MNERINSMSELMSMVIGLSAILFSGVTAGFSILAYCKVVGLEKSTHKVQFMPVPTPQGKDANPTGADLAKKFMPEEEW